MPAVEMDGDQPKVDPATGQPTPFGVFFPREQATILDTWHTLGMRGTGSTDYRRAGSVRARPSDGPGRSARAAGARLRGAAVPDVAVDRDHGRGDRVGRRRRGGGRRRRSSSARPRRRPTTRHRCASSSCRSSRSARPRPGSRRRATRSIAAAERGLRRGRAQRRRCCRATPRSACSSRSASRPRRAPRRCGS